MYQRAGKQWKSKHVNKVKELSDKVLGIVNYKNGNNKRRMVTDYSLEIGQHMINIIMLCVEQEKKISFIEGQLKKQEEIVAIKKRIETDTLDTIMKKQKLQGSYGKRYICGRGGKRIRSCYRGWRKGAMRVGAR